MMRRLAWLWAAFVMVGCAVVGVVPSSAAAPPAATPVRALTWNIFHGGGGPGWNDETNKQQTLDQIVSVAPDVFFSVETYGLGTRIRDALTQRAGKGTYFAAQITPGSSDNLWLFTRFPIVATYPPVSGGISSFNFGGVRVRLPNARELNLFPVWTNYSNPWIGDLIDQNATDIAAGRPPRHTPAAVVHEERVQLGQTTTVLSELTRILGGNQAPTLVGGDLNTVPSSDWSAANARCPSHYGQSFDLRTTARWTAAGFSDTYRTANPNPCTHPGRTWSPHEPGDLVPQRIDFTFARGSIQTTDATIIDRRLPAHGSGSFYSDHAAVVTNHQIP